MTDNITPSQPDPKPTHYAWSSITMATRNYGNFFIEWSLKQLLDLPESDIMFDSFQPMTQSQIDSINETCDFVLNPGCTTLQPGENAALESFAKITVAKPCFGGCLWEFGNRSKMQLALKTLAPAKYAMRTGRGQTPGLSIVEQMSSPVGSRDPYTHDILQKGGIDSVFVGCPTVLSPEPVRQWKKMEGRRLTVSLSRYALGAQLRLIRRLRKFWDITVLVHEEYENYILKLLGGVKIVNFDSAEQFFGHYRDGDAVLTGRLHGALPAIRFGTPVVFFGNPCDTRFSLLSYLGLAIRPLSMDLADLETFPEISAPDPEIYEKVHQLENNFISYCRQYGIQSNLNV